jgi:hypothetical protein
MYYLCTPLRLGVGSVVEPGNWGRIFRLNNRHNSVDESLRLHRELAYELGRKLYAPTAPSRLNCSFVCPSIDDAIEFQRTNQPLSVLNEVEPVDMNNSVHMTCWDLFDGPRPGEDFETLEQVVQRYWTETPSTHKEVLLGGAVRILSIFPQ